MTDGEAYKIAVEILFGLTGTPSDITKVVAKLQAVYAEKNS